MSANEVLHFEPSELHRTALELCSITRRVEAALPIRKYEVKQQLLRETGAIRDQIACADLKLGTTEDYCSIRLAQQSAERCFELLDNLLMIRMGGRGVTAGLEILERVRAGLSERVDDKERAQE